MFDEVVDKVFQDERLSFPCYEHGPEIIYQLIQYFVTMRMQEYCRRMKAEQEKVNQQKKAAKVCIS